MIDLSVRINQESSVLVVRPACPYGFSASAPHSARDNAIDVLHGGNMDTALLRTIMTAVPELENLTADKIDALWDACNRFFEWEKRVMLHGNPTDQDKADHKAVLKWLTTIVKLTAKTNNRNEDLEMMLFRLDGSRAMFYSSLSKKEADAILAKAFPE